MRFASLLVTIALGVVAACSSSETVVQVVDNGDASVPPPAPPSDDAGDDADAGQTTPSGVNLSGGKTLYEAEDQLAVASDGTIAVLYSYIGSNTEGMSYRFSADDGKTWSTAGNIVLPQNDLFAGDPAITTDAAGNFWAAFLGIHYNGTSVDYIRIYAAKAPKGSTQFGAPVEVTDTAVTKFHDHPKIFVTAAGTIVVAYLESDNETSNTGAGIAATSTNGTDWTRKTLVTTPDATFANLFSMCEGTGALYATFFQIGSTTYGIGIRKSTDEGLTWSATTNVSLDSEQPAGLDPRCAAKGSDVWVSYAQTDMPATSEENLEAASSIVVAHSSNGATSFPDRGEALDAKATKLGCLPEFVRDDSGGLDVAYIAGNMDGDFMGSVRYTRATSALTFGASSVVDSPVRFAMGRSVPTWLGDYFGFAAHGKTLYFAYPQNQTGKTHIYFAKAALP